MVDFPEPGFDGGVDDLFLAALELEPAARSPFLDTACGQNIALRTEVEALLAIADASPDLLVPPEIGLIPERLGRYDLLNERGRGGMGIVFEARDSRLLRTVALKVLPQYLSHDTRSLQRFTREAQLLARLNHPNIATLHSLDESDGFHFLTMEFVEGVTLAEILSERLLTPRETLSLGLQVTLALESAHALGVCHCDLKPANIMVANGGKISLLDFGIARAFEQLVASPTQEELDGPTVTLPSGTPGYMAPEQSAGQPVDERSDMWAFGVILFECLTGRPFPLQVADEETKWEDKLPGKTPGDLVALMRECLVRDPAKRLGSASKGRALLEHLMSRRASRRRWLAAGGGVLTVMAVALWFLVLRGPSGPVVKLQNTDEQTLAASNEKGEVLWSRHFDNYRVFSPVVTRSRVKDTSAVGEWEVTGCAAIVELAHYKGSLEFLSPSNGQTIWTRLPAWTVPVNARGPSQYPWLFTFSWPGQESEILVAGIRDGPWYGFAIECVDIEGRLLDIYHHPGVLKPLPRSLAPNNALGGPILFGINSSARFDRTLVPFASENHLGCVLQLDPGDISGQAFPYSSNLPEDRDWPGMPRAKEKAYLLFPMVHPSLSSSVASVVAGEPQSGVEVYTVFLDDGRIVLLDENLFPLKCIVGLKGSMEKLWQEGETVNPPFLYIRYGEMQWVNLPLGY